MSNRFGIDPSILPPSPIVYHQIKVWCCLSNIDIDPLNWGWEMRYESLLAKSILIPLGILTDKEPCSQEILQIIRCSCKEPCGKRCPCQKAGMKCLKSCKECLGVTCENKLTEIFESSLEVDDSLGLNDR